MNETIRAKANVSRLCGLYGYDGRVRRHLQDIVEILHKDIDRPSSIILYGSFARGEPTLVQINDRREIFSDYDVFVYTGRKSISGDRPKRNLQEYAANIGMENSLFHIGLKLRGDKELKEEPLLFHLYDISTYGFVLSGSFERNRFPRVSLLALARSIPLSLETRLWYTLLYLPKNENTLVQRCQTNYLAIRAILDVISAICVLDGCLPRSYLDRYERVQHFGGNRYLRNFITEENELLYRCVIAKIHGDLGFDTGSLIPKLERFYRIFFQFFFEQTKTVSPAYGVAFMKDIEILLTGLKHLASHPGRSSRGWQTSNSICRSLADYSKRRFRAHRFERKDQYILYSEKGEMWRGQNY